MRQDSGRPADRRRLFIYRGVAVAEVSAALEAFVAAGRLHRYESGGKAVLQFVNWWNHQDPRFAAASVFAPPEGWTDRIKTRTNGEYVESGWEMTGGFDARLRDSKEELARESRTKALRRLGWRSSALIRRTSPLT